MASTNTGSVFEKVWSDGSTTSYGAYATSGRLARSNEPRPWVVTPTWFAIAGLSRLGVPLLIKDIVGLT
jgi:hypothetical protein